MHDYRSKAVTALHFISACIRRNSRTKQGAHSCRAAVCWTAFPRHPMRRGIPNLLCSKEAGGVAEWLKAAVLKCESHRQADPGNVVAGSSTPLSIADAH